MFCNTVFGEKEPLHDKRPTHGICVPCFEEFRARYENQETVRQELQNLRAIQIKLPHGQGESLGGTDIGLPTVKDVNRPLDRITS